MDDIIQNNNINNNINNSINNLALIALFDRVRDSRSIVEETIKKYVFFKSENYASLVSFWIVSTYFYDFFNTFPFLHLQGLKGSGKTRLLRLISKFSFGGLLTSDFTEASLFRSEKRTLCLDEVEKLSKENFENLSALLKASYKKSSTALRVEKDKKNNFVVVNYDLYKPLAFANIQGMEDVLQSRALKVWTERTYDQKFIFLVENFNGGVFDVVINNLLFVRSVLVEQYLNFFENLSELWNDYIKFRAGVVSDVKSVLFCDENSFLNSLFDEIYAGFVNVRVGRDFELFFPLAVVAVLCGEGSLFFSTLKFCLSEKNEERISDFESEILLFLMSHKREFEHDFVLLQTVHGLFVQENFNVNYRRFNNLLKEMFIIKDKKLKGSERKTSVLFDYEKIFSKCEALGLLSLVSDDVLKSFEGQQVLVNDDGKNNFEKVTDLKIFLKSFEVLKDELQLDVLKVSEIEKKFYDSGGVNFKHVLQKVLSDGLFFENPEGFLQKNKNKVEGVLFDG